MLKALQPRVAGFDFAWLHVKPLAAAGGGCLAVKETERCMAYVAAGKVRGVMACPAW